MAEPIVIRSPTAEQTTFLLPLFFFIRFLKLFWLFFIHFLLLLFLLLDKIFDIGARGPHTYYCPEQACWPAGRTMHYFYDFAWLSYLLFLIILINFLLLLSLLFDKIFDIRARGPHTYHCPEQACWPAGRTMHYFYDFSWLSYLLFFDYFYSFDAFYSFPLKRMHFHCHFLWLGPTCYHCYRYMAFITLVITTISINVHVVVL